MIEKRIADSLLQGDIRSADNLEERLLMIELGSELRNIERLSQGKSSYLQLLTQLACFHRYKIFC